VFPPTTLDSSGCPVWLSELAEDHPHHALHIVRGLEPAEALEALGAEPHLFQPVVLPRKKDTASSLPGTALGFDLGTSGSLLAGRIGAWTFVYDDSMSTSVEDTVTLSANGRTAATNTVSINADVSFAYAVDGVYAYIGEPDLERDLPAMPDELRAAFQAAGTVGYDGDIEMRAICALAGLYCTMADLRRIPLLATPFG
jgi:hypothetical protein